MNSPVKTKTRAFRFGGKRGFTLIEIVVAMAILSIALLGLTSVTVMVVKGNFFSKTVTTATTLANDRMERLKNQAFASLASGSDSVTLDSAVYTRAWTITANSPATNMTTIEVRVNWNWQGASRNVTIRNIVAK